MFDLGFGEEGEVIHAGKDSVGVGPVVIEVMRLAMEDAAELLEVGEVQAFGPAGMEVLGGLRLEAVLDHVGIGVLDAFDEGDAGDVEGDHGRSDKGLKTSDSRWRTPNPKVMLSGGRTQFPGGRARFPERMSGPT